MQKVERFKHLHSTTTNQTTNTMFTPINAEALVQQLHETYGYSAPLDYAINYIEMNPYATVDDFLYWLQGCDTYTDNE